MKVIVLLSLIALSFGAIKQLEMTEANLLQDLTDDKNDDIIETFLEFLGQVTNQTNFVSDLETVWNETVAVQRNVTNFNNLIQESNRIFGERATVVLQDCLEMIYYGKTNTSLIQTAIQKFIADLGFFLFPGSDSLGAFLRDVVNTEMDWISYSHLKVTDVQNMVEGILGLLNVKTSEYQTEVQEFAQVIYNYYFAPSNEENYDGGESQGQSNNTDVIQLINNLAQIFNNNTNLEDIVAQDILQIWNQSVSSQLNVTLIKTFIGDASNLFIERFAAEESIIEDAMQTFDDIITLSATNDSTIFSIIKNISESLLTNFTSHQGLNPSIVPSAQILIQASLKLLGNTSGPKSLISESLEIISEILSSGHFNVTDLIPLIEDAFELVGNDTEYAGIIQGLVEVLNDIASGQEINVANLALDIEEAFSDIAFGNSSYFNNAIQDLILIIQGQATATNILNFALNTAQVVADVTGYSGPIENAINIVEDLTSGDPKILNLVENSAELLGELTGYGDIVQDALKVVHDITSGDPLSFLEDVIQVIADVTGLGDLGDLAQDAEMIKYGDELFSILSSFGSGDSDIPDLINIALQIFGKATNTAALASDLAQAVQDIDMSNKRVNFTLVAVDGANIAHDLEGLDVVKPNQGNMETIVGDTFEMLGATTWQTYLVFRDFVNVYSSFTSGNITKEIFIENIITLMEDNFEMMSSKESMPSKYNMHSLIANAFEIVNGFTSDQLTADELLEDIITILADFYLINQKDSVLQYVSVQNIVQVLRDYKARDIESLVEDTIDLLAVLQIINPEARVLSKSIATTIAIDQYASNPNQDNDMDNGEEALFY